MSGPSPGDLCLSELQSYFILYTPCCFCRTHRVESVDQRPYKEQQRSQSVPGTAKVTDLYSLSMFLSVTCLCCFCLYRKALPFTCAGYQVDVHCMDLSGPLTRKRYTRKCPFSPTLRTSKNLAPLTLTLIPHKVTLIQCQYGCVRA